MEDIDYVASRTVVAGGMGGLLGAAVATYKGHLVPRVAQSMAMSWAMTATACIGTQRLALAAGRQLLCGGSDPPPSFVLASHGVGGMVGGGILGYLYIKRPLRGMVFLTPVMLAVGLIEVRFEKAKREDPHEKKKKELKLTRGQDGSAVETTTRPKEETIDARGFRWRSVPPK